MLSRNAPWHRGPVPFYKEVLNKLETESPGTKHMFYWGFLEKQRKTETSVSMMDKDRSTLHPCSLCGQPTTAETCSYCKLMARAKVSTSL